MHDDGRWLCLECMESAVMDTYEAHNLHLEIREFFHGLNMEIEKEFPLLLVEKQALYKAEEEEKIVSTISLLIIFSSLFVYSHVSIQAGGSAWCGNQRYLPV